MELELVNSIIKSILQLPGLAGIASIDFEDDGSPLNSGDYQKGISIIKRADNKHIVNVAVILLDGTRAKGVVNDASYAIKNVMSKSQLNVESINIYIRGVK